VILNRCLHGMAPWRHGALLALLGFGACLEGALLQIEKSQARSGAVIFYNLFIRSEKDIPRVREIVHEQLNLVMDPLDQDIRINSIGALTNLSSLKLSKELEKSTKLLAHYEEGFENLTLRDLWSFCKGADPQQLVVYLHSKGSFHSWRGQNGRHRYYVTSGALSQECMHMPKQCNVCSSRMTPVPHPHSPGNMWAARCGYIAKLIDPKDFRDLMNSSALASHGAPWCTGRGRFSNEHWVNSHPDSAPCDLDTNQSYVAGPAPSSTFDKKLEKAPRFAMSQYPVRSKKCDSQTGKSLADRLAEYQYLYSRDPGEDWWGWRHFMQNSSDSARST